ncbi:MULTISPECIES: hypothetical protein [Halorussus]|uniref:hypothetical protein n=1 Tax=Halorussus TaxID=1070314 RepID=UPI0020A0ACE1|nr:hypothetical protein [Halorussus vallis]USZ78695.1 hypothetical protein NGM07_24605 [Halorussus vallis]
MPENSTNLVDRVVKTVESQTAGPVPDRARERTILIVLSVHGSRDSDSVRDALAAAVEAGRLETDGERYWLSDEEVENRAESVMTLTPEEKTEM